MRQKAYSDLTEDPAEVADGCGSGFASSELSYRNSEAFGISLTNLSPSKDLRYSLCLRWN